MPKKKRRPRKQQRPAATPGPAAHRPRTDPPGAAFGLVPDPPAPYPFLPPGVPADVWPGAGPVREDGWDEEDDWDDDLDEDDVDEYDLAELWPSFLGAPVDPREDERAFTPEEHVAALRESVFVRRADQLLAWLGDGRPVTDAGGLRSEDVVELVTLLDLTTGPLPTTAPPGVGDVPELELLWESLVGAGFVDLAETTATPAAGLVPWPTESSPQDEYAKAGDMLLLTALVYFLGGDGDEDATMAAIPPLTYMALLTAAQLEGVRLEAGLDETDDLYAEMVTEDLDTLTAAGILSLEDDTYRLPPQFVTVLLLAAHAVTADLVDDE